MWCWTFHLRNQQQYNWLLACTILLSVALLGVSATLFALAGKTAADADEDDTLDETNFPTYMSGGIVSLLLALCVAKLWIGWCCMRECGVDMNRVMPPVSLSSTSTSSWVSSANVSCLE